MHTKIYYTREQVKEAIKLRLDNLERQYCSAHPNSFFAQSYEARKQKYLTALSRLDAGQFVSNYFLAKLLGKGARLYGDDK